MKVPERGTEGQKRDERKGRRWGKKKTTQFSGSSKRMAAASPAKKVKGGLTPTFDCTKTAPGEALTAHQARMVREKVHMRELFAGEGGAARFGRMSTRWQTGTGEELLLALWGRRPVASPPDDPLAVAWLAHGGN